MSADPIREALEPFARMGELIETETSGFADDDELSLIIESGHLMDRFKVSDFRRAREAISLLTTNDDELVERVARAIYRKYSRSRGLNDVLSIRPDYVRDLWRDCARAALSSMPTIADEGERARLGDAILAVVDAVRDYLPPDGIDEQECLNRVIGAVDNPKINPVIRALQSSASASVGEG
jgi:hypothetical protein